MTITEDNIYFTIDIRDRRIAGFTDLLFFFSIYYKLGILLGYNYVHTNFISSRSSTEVFDFLGFNQHWDDKIENFNYNNIRFIDLFLSIEEIQEINNVESLLEYCREKIQKYIVTNSQKIIVIRFGKLNITLKGRLQLDRIIKKNTPLYPDGLSLKDFYRKQRSIDKKQLFKSQSKFNLLVHIRLGDTAQIPTSSDTFINSHNIFKFLLNPIKNIQYIKNIEYVDSRNYLLPHDFYTFLHNLVTNIDIDISTFVFSDGYERGCNLVKQYINYLKLSKILKEELKNINYKDYDTHCFKKFTNIPNCNCFIGESDELLFKFIDTALNVNLILTGTSARFIPKLIGNFHDRQSKKIIILLHKDNYDYRYYGTNFGLCEDKATVIPVNILENIDFKSLSEKIFQ